MKRLILILTLFLSISTGFALCNTSFTSYSNFTINNSNSALTSYPLYMRMNVSGIAGTSSNTNGSDYVPFNGASPIPFCFISANSTDFYFYLNGTLANGNTTYQMCYGDSTLPESISNCSQVFGTDTTRVYPLDSRTTDIISGANGTLSASNPTANVGRRGFTNGAYHFTSANSQYISASDSGLPNIKNGSTICAWFNTSQAATQVLVGYGTHSGFQDRNSIGTAGPMIGGTATGGGESGSGVHYAANAWTLECLMVNGTLWNTCSNGTASTGGSCSAPTTLGSTSTVLGGSSGFVIGALGTSSLFFNGDVQDVVVWNKVLTTDEISNLYARTEPTWSFGPRESLVVSNYTLPTINITSPLNNSIHKNLTFLLNITSNGTNLTRTSYAVCLTVGIGPCGVSQDNWANFTTPINITESFSGYYKVEAYAKDSLNNLTNANTTYFILDVDGPLIQFLSPLNTTYNSTNILLDLNITDDLTGVNKTFYSLNGAANQTYTVPVNITAIQGNNTIEIWANDSAGNFNVSSIVFTVDTIAPTITIISPINGTYNQTYVELNVSASDIHLESIWYDNGITNTTYTSPINLTGLTFGPHTLVVYANDTYGNVNSSSITFTINASGFSVGLLNPPYASIGNLTQLFIYDVNLTISSIVSCNLSVDTIVENQVDLTLSGSQGVVLAVGPGIHSWFVSCNDSFSTITTPTWIFQAGSSVGSSTVILSNSSQPFMASPQSIFYEPNGNLGLFYFTNTTPTNMLWYHSITVGALNQTFSTSLNATKQFLAGFREANSIMFIAYGNDNTTKYIYNLTNSGLSTSSSAITLNVLSNSEYDPMQYANTRNIANITPTANSYYIYMLPTDNATRLMRLNYSSTSTGQINITNHSVGVFKQIHPVWQTIANDSTLENWYFAFPSNSTPCSASNQLISIYHYNGTNQIKLATPDNTCFSPIEINTTSKVFFEQSGKNTYALIAGLTNRTTIYQIEGNKAFSFNNTVLNPSQLMFIENDTTVFFSTESGVEYAYTCYFGGPAANCSRTASPQYGGSVQYTVGPMTTARRSGTSDIIVSGSLANNPILELQIAQYDFDVKYICNNELNWSQRLPFTVSTLSNTSSVVLSNVIWGYAIQSNMLGNGTKQTYFTCYPGGVQRELISGLNNNYFLNFYSLDNVSGAYYTFTVKDAYGTLVPNVLVSAYRYNTFTNTQVPIAQGISDFTGAVILYLQPFQQYTLVVTASGFATISSVFTPGTNTQPIISLSSAGSQFIQMPNWYYENNEISYTIGPIVSIINQTTNATFLISANNSDLQYFGMTVSLVNVSQLIPVCQVNITTQPQGGAVYCQMNQTGTYHISPFWKVQNFSPKGVAPKVVVFASNVTFQEAINIFQNSQPIGGWAFYAIALIIAMIAGGWMMRYSVDGAGLAVIAVLWFFTFFNPNACMLPLNSGNAFDPSMVYGSAAIANGVICITPFVATVFTTIATLSALFLVRYL